MCIRDSIHRICFDIHIELLEKYGFETDIVFCRPNYCKIDLMVDNLRGENLFMQENELERLRESPVSYTHLDVYKRQLPSIAV